MKRVTISLALAMTFCARSPGTPKDGSATGGAGGTSNAGGTSKGGNTSNTGGAPSTGGVCNVNIPSEAGATCDIKSPFDGGLPFDAGPASNLTKIGPYSVGHVNYMLSDTAVYVRPVIVSVWYPVISGSITLATPPAQYPLDPWSNNLPVSTSTDWEAFGYDRAYEGVTPSGNGPFPLVMVSPGNGANNWSYVYIGTRLASHGYVVAVTDHYGDQYWPWSPAPDNFVVKMFNRTRDVSFAITKLLQKNSTVGELLQGAIDPSQIAMSGHSVGGYVAYALGGGGDDEVCDALIAVKYGDDTLPEPQFTCAPTLPDSRIRAIASLDGTSSLMRYNELARIAVPTILIGETVEHIISYNDPPFPSDSSQGEWMARAHAAIHRSDSYRVDLMAANHQSFTSYCDAVGVMTRLGVDPNGVGISAQTWPCVAQGTFDPANNLATRQIVTTYMLAFLNTYLGREDDSWMLTSSYARQYQPNVEFFDSEACDECPVGDGEYSYRPHPCQCSVARRDPADYFAPSSDGGTQ